MPNRMYVNVCPTAAHTTLAPPISPIFHSDTLISPPVTNHKSAFLSSSHSSHKWKHLPAPRSYGATGESPFLPLFLMYWSPPLGIQSPSYHI